MFSCYVAHVFSELLLLLLLCFTVSCHRTFPPGTSLEPNFTPTAALSVLHVTLHVFYGESVECVLGMASKCFFKPSVTMLVALIILLA